MSGMPGQILYEQIGYGAITCSFPIKKRVWALSVLMHLNTDVLKQPMCIVFDMPFVQSNATVIRSQISTYT